MPGVVDGQKYWDEQDSQIRGFSSQSHQRAMSPFRHGNEKSGARSHHSNGYSSDQHSEFDDGATYLLEHLATFSVGTQYGLVTPKDGLRRLLQMEKSSGIWTQKMQMRLERNWVIIIDYENGDVVERFPMNLISDPTAYTSDDQRELYNNILIFIVRDDPKSKNHNPSEMHIFQCAQVSAQDVVDEIKMFTSGKGKSRYKDNIRHLPQPPSNPPPDPPVNGISGISVREQVNMFNAAAAASTSQYSPPPRELNPHQRTERSGRSAMYIRESNDETSSTASDKYERDVAVLNHCFDDIERFIARLQHAAAAYKELERRQKSRKNKKKDMGDGMLSIRAKPPPEREFIDILQKFKLSFNLLAKLKSHIHDPNAPELVHFLFTPLALIVDAAKDSNYSSNLASKVISPLLTRDAIELLTNCCTSKETDLWHSLGEPWIIPRDQWKDYEKEYHPVFSDGWAPEYPNFEDRDVSDIAAGVSPPLKNYHRDEIVEEEYHHRLSREDKGGHYDTEFFYGNERLGSRDRSHSPIGIPDRHSRQIYESRQYKHHEETDRREYPAERDPRFTSLSENDYRDTQDRDMRSDFSADSIEHTSTSDPHKQFEWQQQQWLEELKSQSAKIVQVVYPRTANNEKELTVIRGEYLEVLDDSRKWWKARNMRGQVAHVPHTIVTPYNGSNIEDDIFNNPLYATKGSPRENPYNPNESITTKSSFEESNIIGNQESPPRRPPAIPQPAPASADWVRRERQGKKDSSNEQESSMKESTAVQTDDESVLSQKSSESNEHKPNYKNQFENHWESSFETWQIKPSDYVKTQQVLSNKKKSNSIENLETDLKEVQYQLKREMQNQESQQQKLKLNKKWICKEHNKSECSNLKLNSSSAEVKHWLEVKGFSEKAQVILDSMNGETLLSLTKPQLEKYLEEEGLRLFGHLTLQRNICGIKTTRSKELKSILEQRRKLVDGERMSEAKGEPNSSTLLKLNTQRELTTKPIQN